MAAESRGAGTQPPTDAAGTPAAGAVPRPVAGPHRLLPRPLQRAAGRGSVFTSSVMYFALEWDITKHRAHFRSRLLFQATNTRLFYKHIMQEMKPLILRSVGPSPTSCKQPVGTLAVNISFRYLKFFFYLLAQVTSFLTTMLTVASFVPVFWIG